MRFALLLASLIALPVAAAPFAPELARMNEVPTFVLPLARVNQALAARNKAPPFQFAVPVTVPLGLKDGVWDQLADGSARWRLRVQSVGARSLNFHFRRVELPASAKLWLFDEQGALIHGPYTRADRTAEGELWTPVIPAETAVLELHVSAPERPAVALELGAVNHGYRELGKAGTDPTPGGSHPCNVDVACSAGDPWRAEIRAAALIQIGGQYDCSGVLLNNTSMNDDPLFLTANHCLIGQTQSTPASSVVLYWNFQATTCNGSRSNPNLSQTSSGSTLLAGDRSSDFSLVRLNAKPPSSYDVYYAGWDAGSDTPQFGVSIHHPQGDFKRISVYSSPAQRSTITLCDSEPPPGQPCPDADTRTIQAWEVSYTQGTTEQGSSGGGLWNENRQVVGVLSGGAAGCSTSNPDVNNGEPDDYGRVEVAWTASSSASGQLKAHLDPNNTGATTLCGKEQGSTQCAGTSAPSGGFGGSLNGHGGSLGLDLLALLAGAAMARRRT
jgi:hypothetical protein